MPFLKREKGIDLILIDWLQLIVKLIHWFPMLDSFNNVMVSVIWNLMDHVWLMKSLGQQEILSF